MQKCCDHLQDRKKEIVQDSKKYNKSIKAILNWYVEIDLIPSQKHLNCLEDIKGLCGYCTDQIIMEYELEVKFQWGIKDYGYANCMNCLKLRVFKHSLCEECINKHLQKVYEEMKLF